MVNAIPETVTLESYVRGKTFDAIVNANKKVNRALIGGALSLGTNIDVTDIPGYAPLNNDKNMIALTLEAAQISIPEYEMKEGHGFGSGSTDMGDLSCIMPVIHPYAGGATGTSHGNDYYITDPEAACVASAKLQLSMLALLLGGGAERAKKIVEEYEPQFESAKAYLDYVDSLNCTGDRIEYGEEEAKITL
jgi:metal-dependent amidase/aminoacylase/carboxypeptidase family protein